MTIDEQIKAVAREIDYRRRLYPVWIEKGKINKLEADYQIEIMEQVLSTLVSVKEKKIDINATIRDEEKIKRGLML